MQVWSKRKGKHCTIILQLLNMLNIHTHVNIVMSSIKGSRLYWIHPKWFKMPFPASFSVGEKPIMFIQPTSLLKFALLVSNGQRSHAYLISFNNHSYKYCKTAFYASKRVALFKITALLIFHWNLLNMHVTSTDSREQFQQRSRLNKHISFSPTPKKAVLHYFGWVQ